MTTLEEKAERDKRALHYWHLDRLVESGFERHQAEILELAHVDWRDAADLLKHGCPPETALLILT